MLCEITHVTMWVVQLTIEDGVHSGQETVASFKKVKGKDRKVTLVSSPDPTLSRREMVW